MAAESTPTGPWNRIWKFQVCRYPRLISSIISLVVLFGLAIAFGQAVVEDPGDRGKLHLANATAMLSGQSSPVTQRPPLYGATLALLARMASVSPYPQRLDAEEYGNINSFPVASGLYSKRFLRLVLWVQLLILIVTAWLVVITLRLVGASLGWALLALAIFAILSPEAPPDILSETLLTGLLLALALCGFAAWVTGRMSPSALLLVGISSSLAALSHAVFQLLPLFLTAVLYFPVRSAMGRTKARHMAASLLLCWLLIVGGMSAYNLQKHRFFGLSAVLGSGLGTKTWSFMERAAPEYPGVAPVFIGMRNDLLVPFFEHTGVYWGAEACKWLMTERGMSYVSANKYLLQFNLTAIRHGNEVYPIEVLKSLVLFFVPAFPYQVPGPSRFVYYLCKALVFLVFAGACAYRITLWLLSGSRKGGTAKDPRAELVLAAAIGIFLYAAVVVCSADIGRPGQRASVLFTIPIVLALTLRKDGALPARK